MMDTHWRAVGLTRMLQIMDGNQGSTQLAKFHALDALAKLVPFVHFYKLLS